MLSAPQSPLWRADFALHPFLDTAQNIVHRLHVGGLFAFWLGDDIGVRRIGRHLVGTKVGITVLGKDQFHRRQGFKSILDLKLHLRRAGA